MGLCYLYIKCHYKDNQLWLVVQQKEIDSDSLEGKNYDS